MTVKKRKKITIFREYLYIMEYSKYFFQVLKEHGSVQLSQKATDTMWRIIFLEGQQSGLKKARKMIPKNESQHLYDLELFRIGKQITILTGNIRPEELLQQLAKN